MNQTEVTEEAPLEQTRPCRRGLDIGKLISQYWADAAVIALALLLWLPRLSGPIDLRWDSGVYYLLGTSLSTGHGYRIESEPGSPEAVQYPPLLPVFVALEQWALGTTDPQVVAPWLRKSYAAIFVVYGLAVLALARKYLRPGFAVIAVGLCLLQVMTIFLSDLLFAELPFALVAVLFVLIGTARRPTFRPSLREAAMFALATAGFLLRTAGLALLAAWVLEAMMRRQWRFAIARGVIAMLPVILWQAHIARVRSSNEYVHPAYEYQRAAYQYYNVSYAENILLIDPFRPELGPITMPSLFQRSLRNVPSMLVAVGETASTRLGYWQKLLDRPQRRLLRRAVIPEGAAYAPILLCAGLFLVGLFTLARRSRWLLVFVVLGSLALTCTTPWPAQFSRYLMTLAPFSIICVVLGLTNIRDALVKWRIGRTSAQIAVAGFLASIFTAQVIVGVSLFRQFRHKESRPLPAGSSDTTSPLFFHDRSWQAWEETADWIKAHAPPDVIVATTAPHFFYLRTGLRAVLPPMEARPEHARRLMEAVPVSYVIIDELGFLDVSRRYAGPAIDDPTHWRLVHTVDKTKTYARLTNAE